MCALVTVNKSSENESKELDISEKKRDYPDYSIADIGQNTPKSPGDLKRLGVTQTPQKTPVRKTHKYDNRGA